MNEIENKEKIKSSELAETDSFQKAIASRDAMLEKKDAVIKDLKDRLGKREETITSLMEKVDEKEALRIEAESKIVKEKQLEKPGRNYVPKTKEQEFVEKYQEARERLKNYKN